MIESILKYSKQIEESVVSYHCEDFAIFAHGLIKMTKPKSVVELGTGFGVTSFMLAQACKDNQFGKVYSVDDGSQNLECFPDYFEFLSQQRNNFELDEWLQFRKATINQQSDIDLALQGIDDVGFLFNDFNSEPQVIIDLIDWVLPKIKNECYFVTDRGMTYKPAFVTTEGIVKTMNESQKSFHFSSFYVKKSTKSETQDSFSVIKLTRI